MNMKIIALATGVLALAACDTTKPNDPEMLKGAQFTTELNGVPVTLDFDATSPRVFGKIVNNYNGQYQADETKISFGPFASTMMMGPQNMMDAEREYFQFMSTTDTYVLKENTLKIKNTDGKEIVFKRLNTTAQ